MRRFGLTSTPEITGSHGFIIWHWYAWMPNDQFVLPTSIPDRNKLSAADPYLSLVIPIRNDHHCGNRLQKAQAFVHTWINQAKRHNLCSELVLVEWNRPAERTRLADALQWPASLQHCNVRIIELPSAKHQRFSKVPSLNSLIAKNAGIRRARGDFILATNIDLVFSDELVDFFAARKLKADRIYRIDRYDVASDVPLESTLEEQLAYCRRHVTGFCAEDGIFRLTEDGPCAVEARDITDAASGIHFGRGWIPVEQSLSGPIRWIVNYAEVIAEVPRTGGELSLELEPGLSAEPATLELLDRDGTIVGRWAVTGRTMIRMVVPPGPDGCPQKFRFRVPQTGTAWDQWAQNFCVYRCDWVSSPVNANRGVAGFRDLRPMLSRMLSCYLRTRRIGSSLHAAIGARRLLLSRGEDVFQQSTTFVAGKGWHAVEHFGNEKYRWISPGAELLVRCPNERLKLALLVEPGPAVGFRPFTLVVRHPDGTLLAKARVDGLTYVELAPIPAEIGYVHVMFNAEDCGGGPVQLQDDPRLMIFRIHACGFQPGQAQTAGDRHLSVWLSGAVALSDTKIDSRGHRDQSQRELAAFAAPERLHIYGGGDFILMARGDWFNLRGFPELEQYSPQLEAVLCYAAHYAGLQQEILADPMRIYRIGHSLDPAGIPVPNEVSERGPSTSTACVTPEDLFALMNQMRTVNSPVIFNLDDWGLGKNELTETSAASECNV